MLYVFKWEKELYISQFKSKATGVRHVKSWNRPKARNVAPNHWTSCESKEKFLKKIKSASQSERTNGKKVKSLIADLEEAIF